MSIDSAIEEAASIIRQSHSAVSLTGAGISTSAGIPDFRSPGEGLWEKDPSKMSLFTAEGFAGDPKGFYEFGKEMLPSFRNAKPTPAHRLLSRLEADGRLRCVITQNIDGLHQKAGSKNVVEVHGSLSTGRCTNSACAIKFTLEEITREMERGIPPLCPRCRSLIRPNVVLFGEALPEEACQQAIEALRSCDLLLVMGTSLVVYPVADMPGIALEHDARLIIINLQPTHYDARADVLIRSPLDVAAERLAIALGISL